jgi:hypothetical protein
MESAAWGMLRWAARRSRFKMPLYSSVMQRGVPCFEGFPMQYAVTAGFLLAVVGVGFAVVILGGYGIAHPIASAL